MISDDPPPMSNITVERASRSARSPQPAAARWRLGLAVDDLELDAEPLADRGDEGRPVGGGAAGLGGDGASPGHAARRHLVAADLQGLERARDRRLAQASGLRQSLAEPNDARERVDDAKPVGGRPRNQEPAIVGAQIERRISPAPAIARAGRRATELENSARTPGSELHVET